MKSSLNSTPDIKTITVANEVPDGLEVLGVLDPEIVGHVAVGDVLLCRNTETAELAIVEREYNIEDNHIKPADDIEGANSGSGQEQHTVSPIDPVEGGGGSITYLTSGDRWLPASPGTGYQSTELHFDEAYEGGTDRSDGDGNSIRMPRGVTVSTEGLDERDARLVPSEEQIEGLLPLHSWKDKRRARLIIEKLRNYGLGSELPQVKPSQIIKWSARRSWVILPTELKRVMLHSGDDSKPSILTAVGRSTNCPELGITVSPRGRRGLDIAISNGSEIVLIRKRRGLFTRLEVSSDKEPNLLEEAISILYDENWGIAAGVIRSEPLSGALGVS